MKTLTPRSDHDLDNAVKEQRHGVLKRGRIRSVRREGEADRSATEPERPGSGWRVGKLLQWRKKERMSAAAEARNAAASGAERVPAAEVGLGAGASAAEATAARDAAATAATQIARSLLTMGAIALSFSFFVGSSKRRKKMRKERSEARVLVGGGERSEFSETEW